MIWLVGRLYKRNATLDPAAKVVQAVLTAFALLLAGLWYFVERKGMSHAEIKVTADGARVSPELALVQLRIETKNVGFIVLRARHWDVRLLSIVPSYKMPLPQIATLPRGAWPEKVAGENAYFDQELRWKVIRRFDGDDLHEVEPGELDVKSMDWLVPCSFRVLRATVAVEKPDKSWNWRALLDRPRGIKPEPLWWKDRTMLDLGPICAADIAVGATAKLDQRK
jgi:hypothetical protein